MTFIEVVVWISISSLILLALTEAILYFYRSNRYAIEQATAVTFAQRGVDKMVRHMREAAYSSEGAFPIVSIAANDFVFYADTNSDPLIEKVHLYGEGQFLKEGITEPSGDPPTYSGPETISTVAEYARNLDQGIPLFRYFDKNGVEITNYSQWANTRFVNVSVVVNVDPNKLPNQFVLNSSAALRNLVGK